MNAKNDENFIKTIVAGDESWVYGYDPETKAVSYTHLDVYKRQVRID